MEFNELELFELLKNNPTMRDVFLLGVKHAYKKEASQAILKEINKLEELKKEEQYEQRS